MAKLGDVVKKAKTPTGATVDMMNPVSWGQYIVGTMFFLATLAFGQQLLKKTDEKVTAVDASMKDPFTSPAPAMPGKVQV